MRQLLASLIIAACILQAQPVKPSAEPPSLQFKLTANSKASLAEPLVLTVALVNMSERSIGASSLQSALLTLNVKQVPGGATWRASHGGSVAAISQRNGEVEWTQYVRVRPDRVEVPPLGKIEWSFDLADVFGIRLHPGEYSLNVSYDDELTAETRVLVTIDETATVPALMRLIETGNYASKVWARNSLFILTGYPEWEIERTDTPAELAKRAAELRAWWADNKSRLKAEGNKLVAK